jgi:hypothetical protein
MIVVIAFPDAIGQPDLFEIVHAIDLRRLPIGFGEKWTPKFGP